MVGFHMKMCLSSGVGSGGTARYPCRQDVQFAI